MTQLTKSASDEFSKMLDHLTITTVKRKEDEQGIREDINWNKYKIIKQIKEYLVISWKDIFFDLWLKILIQSIIIFLAYILYTNMDFFYSLVNDYYLAHYIFYVGALLIVIEVFFFWIKTLLDLNIILYSHIKVEKEESEVFLPLEEKSSQQLISS